MHSKPDGAKHGFYLLFIIVIFSETFKLESTIFIPELGVGTGELTAAEQASEKWADYFAH